MIKDRPVPNFIAKRMYKRHTLERLKKEMKIVNSGIVISGQRIIDIGCGPGHISIELAKLVGESGKVFALDIHPLSIKCVNELIIKHGVKNVKTILTSKLETGVPDNSIDVVFLFNTYDMIRDKVKLHSEVSRVLKSNGRLIISNNRNFLTTSKKIKLIFNKDDTMNYEYNDGKVYFFRKVIKVN